MAPLLYSLEAVYNQNVVIPTFWFAYKKVENNMAITKLKNNHYKLEVFYPKEVRQILGVTTERYCKIFRTKKKRNRLKKTCLKKFNVCLMKRVLVHLN